MIKSWKNAEIETFFETGKIPRKAKWRRVAKIAARKLDMMAAASELKDLRSPPGNRLEALKGDRDGQHSIRINDQWRVCFIWEDGSACEVDITDYH